jgi:hypothetical protein
MPKPRRIWNDEWDGLLLHWIDYYGGKNYAKIALRLSVETGEDFNYHQVQHRWRLLEARQRLGAERGRLWTPDEDEKLIKAVQEHGPKKWETISTEVGTRDHKQCRNRWFEQLDPRINKGPWSLEEDAYIIAQHMAIGPMWCNIASGMNGRTGNMVKNRWHTAIRKRLEVNFDDNVNSSSTDSVPEEYDFDLSNLLLNPIEPLPLILEDL